VPKISHIFVYDPALGRMTRTVAPAAGGETAKPERAKPSAAPTDPDPLSTRPDPSRMMMPWPFAREGRHAPKATAPGAKPESSRVTFHSRWRALEQRVGSAELDHVRGLCRRLNPQAWAELFIAFCVAMERTTQSRPQWLQRRDRALDAGWHLEPWYYVDPRYFHAPRESDATLKDLCRGLAYVRGLGFRNLALLTDVDPAAMLGVAPEYRPVIELADRLELRIVTGMDLAPKAGLQVDAGLDDIRQPAVLAEVLTRLGRELNLGVAGKRAHSIDRWLTPEDGDDRAHALSALVKAFLRLVSNRDVLIPEASDPESELSFTGGGTTFGGEASTTEGDLVHWHEGMVALRAALTSECADPVRALLQNVPTVLHHGALEVSLEHHDRAYRRACGATEHLVRLLDRDATRIAAALACLYFLPAVPIVYAGSELSARTRRLSARRLTLGAASNGPAVRFLRFANERRWSGPARVLPTAPHVLALERGELRGVVNLGSKPCTVRLDTEREWREVHREPAESDRLGERRSPLPLAAHGFVVLSSEPKA